MAQLIFHPNSANAWAYTLKEGSNTIGRSDDNDVRIGEGGVSGHHCTVSLNQGVVTITDLNSTNGTHINGNRITQASWAPGQTLQLGEIPVRLEGVDLVQSAIPAAIPLAIPLAAPIAAPVAAAVAAAAPAPVSKGPIRLRIAGSGGSHAPAPAAAAVVEAPVAELPPALEHAHGITAPAGTRCKSHSKSPAAWYCPKCRKFFCDLCVATRASTSGPKHNCRSCGSDCDPVHLERSGPVHEKGFFARLPEAFIYPFKGAGSLVLIVATLVFAALSAVSGIFNILLSMMATGYLFLFLQNIIHATAAEENEMPSLPDFDGLFGAFFTLLGTIAISFIIPIILGIARLSGVEIPVSVIIASIFVSLIYFPMAFLAVAMLDSVAAANPLVIIPSILKVPGQYIVTVIMISIVFGVRILGDVFSGVAGSETYTTRSMSVLFIGIGVQAVWSFIRIYLLTVTMRILGNLYLTQRDKLGWL